MPVSGAKERERPRARVVTVSRKETGHIKQESHGVNHFSYLGPRFQADAKKSSCQQTGKRKVSLGRHG